MAGGRPTTYRPENAEIARNTCIVGATNESLAERFGVCRRTIDNWIATIPEFSDAVRQGREVADEAVVSALFARATGMEQKDDQGLLPSRPAGDGELHRAPAARCPRLLLLAAQSPALAVAREPTARRGGGRPELGERARSRFRKGTPCRRRRARRPERGRRTSPACPERSRGKRSRTGRPECGRTTASALSAVMTFKFLSPREARAIAYGARKRFRRPDQGPKGRAEGPSLNNKPPIVETRSLRSALRAPVETTGIVKCDKPTRQRERRSLGASHVHRC
jgi:hypothetical protein